MHGLIVHVHTITSLDKGGERDMASYSLMSQTLYRLVPARTKGSDHSCKHFWCSWNALISVWNFCLKLDVDRITLRVYNSKLKEALEEWSYVCDLPLYWLSTQ